LIIPDVNLLLYAYHAGVVQHERARRWVEAAFSGNEPVRLPWLCIGAFLRIATHPQVFADPYTTVEAVSIVQSWFAAPAVAVIEPGERYWAILSRLVVDAQVRGALVTDAMLAAMAIEAGATLATTDRDFRRFDGLKLLDPIAAA
jgi:uncharacterized protein